MATLKVTFLSSLILELVATISVALVAVAIGLRLMGGELGLQAALFALVLAPEASDGEVERACVSVGLGPLLASLPEGIHTQLGERGSGISAGERQRVALARAWVRDAEVLLLDEPTANLDGESEREVLEATRRLAEGRTAIVAAHRPALLELADRVIDLGGAAAGDGGRRLDAVGALA